LGLGTTKHHWTVGLLARPPGCILAKSEAKKKTRLHPKTNVPVLKNTRFPGLKVLEGLENPALRMIVPQSLR
jgi:hypothetical protein